MGNNKNVDFILKLSNKVAENKILRIISNSMIRTIFVTLSGSIIVLLMVLLKNLNLTEYIGILRIGNTFTMGMLAVYLVFLIAKNYYAQALPNEDGTVVGLIAIASFLILTPLQNNEGALSLSFEWTGSNGIFTAILVGLLVSSIYAFIVKKRWVIRMPKAVPEGISKSFESISPAIIIFFLTMTLSYAWSLSSFGSLHQFIYAMVQTPLQAFVGNNIWFLMLITTLAQILWLFGIHGNTVTNPFIMPVLMAMDAQNLAAASAGLALPNNIGYAFYATYTMSGTLIGFALMLLFSKSKQYRSIGRIVAGPAVFGITEPIVFGLPLIMNVTFAIPFIFGNALSLLIAYLATVSRLVPPLIGASYIFGLPLGFSASYQGSWRIVVLQIVLQITIALFYFPFWKFADKRAVQEELAYELENDSSDS